MYFDVPNLCFLTYDLLQELAAAKRHLAEQEEVTRQITEANIRLQQEKGQLQQEKGQLQQQVQQQQTQTERMEHENSQMKQDKQQIQGQKDQLQQEKGELQQQNNQLQQEKDELQQRNDHLQREKNQLNHEKEHLHQQLARATEQSDATGTNPRLQRRLREAEGRLHEYESVLIISEEEVQMTGPRLGGGSFGGQVHLSFCLNKVHNATLLFRSVCSCVARSTSCSQAIS